MFHQPPPQDTPDQPLTPEQERVLAKFRRFSSISILVMVIGVAAVFGVIAYRMLRDKPVATGEITLMLPKGAQIVSASAAGDMVVLVLNIEGATEVRTFNARTLAPAGKLRFAQEP